MALDAFRGIAAVGIAIFHFRWTHAELFASPLFDRVFSLLDFFFVLGGFVLAHVYLSKPLDTRDFAWRRLARLYPLHVFALLMFLLLQLGKLAVIKLGMGARQDAFEGMNALNFIDTLFLLQSTGLFGEGISWNYPSWTVSTELASAIVIYGLVAYCGRAALVPICIAIVAGSIAYMYLADVRPSDYGPNAFVRTLYGLALGCLTYSFYSRWRLVRGPFWSAFGEVVVVAAVFVAISSPATLGYWYLITPGLAVAIYVFAGEQGLISMIFRRMQVHRLGTGSYSIYLNHALVGTVFSKAYLAVAPKLGLAGVASAAIYVPLFVAVLLLYSRLTLFYIERPGVGFVLGVRKRLAQVRWRALLPRRSPVPAARMAVALSMRKRRPGARQRLSGAEGGPPRRPA